MVNSYRYAFAASTGTIPSSGTTTDLGIGEIGVFDGKTWQATNGVLAKSIIIAQGVPSTVFPQGVAKGNFTLKTEVVKGKSVRKWTKVPAQRGQGMITTMGFDGVDTNKGLTVKQGDTFTFWITLSGTPIANLLGDAPETHYATWTEQFTVTLPCVDSCTDTCGTFVDQNIVADAAIEAVKARKIIGGQPITDYIKLTKLVDCETPSGLPTVSYTIYTLVVPDSGDQAALGKVQAQYPGEAIKRIKRQDIFSTYEITVPTGDGAPDPFVNDQNPVVAICSECPSGCPSGYSPSTALDVWIVQRPLSANSDVHDGTAQTTFASAVQAGYAGAGATASEFLSYNGAAATVKLYFTAGSTPTAILADTIVLIGTNESICTQDSPTSIDWVECRTCTAAKKSYVLTVKDTDCGGVFTDAITAQYGQVPTVVTNSGTCTSQYTISVESTNKDCDACDDVQWTFAQPAPFNGLTWTEVLGDTGYGTGCVTGIKMESIYEQRKSKECFLKQVAYEFEPLFVEFSTRNPDPNNYAVLCETDVPVTVVQNVKYPRGFGRVVADHMIASMYQYNQPWRKNAAERDAFEYELGIDLQGYYDQYVLEYVTHPDTFGASHFGTTQEQTFEHSFFFAEGTGGDFESVVTAFVSSNSDVELEQIS